MLVTFYCEHCNAKLRITADAMGTELLCPECESQLQVPVMQLGPGFVLGGFLIKHKIGEGGMGEVYLAKQLSLERDVALKILPSRYTREKSFIVRFLKEVHYQANLDHPNIVTAYDAGEDNGVYFMAMAYVPGETLEEWLEREGTLAEKDALQVIRQVAQALKYASEEKGILHRDIKPANIMLTPSMHAKVLDMGLSKNTLEKQSATLADTLMGTPNYMSPEQIDHPQDLDTRSDMFSLGMTLYHMLTGQVPFEESGYLKTLKRHAHDKLEDPRNLMPGISEGAALLLARMLAREPDHRYADWGGFLQDLNRITTNKGIPEIPQGECTVDFIPPAPPKPKITVQHHPPKRNYPPKKQKSPEGIIMSVVIGLMLGVTGVVIVASQQTKLSDPDDPPEPSTAATTPPQPSPTPSLSQIALQKELTSIILNYERSRSSYDEVIQSLLDVGFRAENGQVSDDAAQQIVRVRRDRDAALELEQDRLREETIRILYNQGPEPARQYLDQYRSEFTNDLTAQIQNLRRRILIWEQQERSQRESEKAAAENWLLKLEQQLAPVIVSREWPRAMAMLDEAAEQPAMFPVATEITELRNQVIDLQNVPNRVLKSYESQLLQEVVLKLHDKDLAVQIRELKPDGLLVNRTVFSEDGTPVGNAELFIPFSQLSTQEILDQLDLLNGPEILIFRALISHRNGETQTCRELLEEADTLVSLAIRDELFPPTALDDPFAEAREEGEPGSMINTPHFVPLPRIESP